MNSLDAELALLKLSLDSREDFMEIASEIKSVDFTGPNAHLFETIASHKEFLKVGEEVVAGRVRGWDARKFSQLIDYFALPVNLSDIEDLKLMAQEIVEATEGARQKGLRPIKEVLADLLDELEGGHMRYIPTGYQALDRILTGFYNQDLVILAARPSMGKTAFAGNLALNIAAQGYPTAFFSLEMKDQAIVGRCLASMSGISSQKIRSGQVYEPEWPKITVGASKLANLPLYIDDHGGLRVEVLHSIAKDWRRRNDGRIMFVDYLQLMEAAGRSNNEVVGKISKGLKVIAKDLDIPVIALSQLSRKLQDRQDKRPQLSDLRDSGAIEADADTVMFLHRDSYYGNDRKDGTTEIIVAKQRSGPLGSVNLDFDGNTQTFRDF
jgi:replicative DNA helicase